MANATSSRLCNVRWVSLRDCRKPQNLRVGIFKHISRGASRNQEVLIDYWIKVCDTKQLNSPFKEFRSCKISQNRSGVRSSWLTKTPKCILWKKHVAFMLIFHWKKIQCLYISFASATCLVPERWQAFTRTDDERAPWRMFASRWRSGIIYAKESLC